MAEIIPEYPIQKAVYGQEIIMISAGHKYYSHDGTYINDVCGQTNFYAPFDCKVVDIDVNNGNTVVFESIGKVITPRYPNKPRKITFRCTHMVDTDFNSIGFWIGKTFSQGSLCYKQGNKWKNRTDGQMDVNGVLKPMDKHIHVEFALGEYVKMNKKFVPYYLETTEKNSTQAASNVKLNQLLPLQDACFISNTAKVKKYYLTESTDPQYSYVMTREKGTAKEANQWYE